MSVLLTPSVYAVCLLSCLVLVCLVCPACPINLFSLLSILSVQSVLSFLSFLSVLCNLSVLSVLYLLSALFILSLCVCLSCLPRLFYHSCPSSIICSHCFVRPVSYWTKVVLSAKSIEYVVLFNLTSIKSIINIFFNPLKNKHHFQHLSPLSFNDP